jgi:hypothetical protein
MNRSTLSLLMAVSMGVAVWSSAARLHSQEAAVAPKTALERLVALKAANAELLQKQEKTLQRLDDLKQQADQLRIMTKRS